MILKIGFVSFRKDSRKCDIIEIERLIFSVFLYILSVAKCTCTRSKFIALDEVVNLYQVYLFCRCYIGNRLFVISVYWWFWLYNFVFGFRKYHFFLIVQTFFLTNTQMQFFIEFYQ